MQECEQELTQKGEMVNRLQAKTSQIGQILTNLERYQNAASTTGNNKDPPRLATQAQAKLRQIPPYKPKPNQTSPSSATPIKPPPQSNTPPAVLSESSK